MSFVTDLVFILPGTVSTDDTVHRARFEASFEAAHGRPIEPAPGGGTKVMDATVYAAGVNYLSWDWVDVLRAQDWPTGTLLWLHPEGDPHAGAGVVVYQLGAKETT